MRWPTCASEPSPPAVRPPRVDVTVSTSRRVARILAVLVAVVLSGAMTACSDDDGEQAAPDPDRFCALLGEAAPLADALGRLDVDAARSHTTTLGTAVGVAPSMIAPDAAVVHAYVEAVLDGWDELDPLTTDTAAAVLSELAEQRPAVEDAGDRLEAHALEQCDLDLGSPLRPPP
jgi:hypothetical protein